MCAELVADLEQVAEELLGPRNKAASTQATWRWGGKGGFKLEIRGRKRGVWHAKDSLKGGGIIGLIAYANSCSNAQAIKWARARTGGPASGFDYQADHTARQAERDRKARDDAAAEAKEAAGRVAYARKLWVASLPIAGTPAEVYLAKTRGIPAASWPDSAVRFHAPTNALIVAATLSDGSVAAVQRVFLTADGKKLGPEELAARRWQAIKQTNGPLAGAVVRLPAVVNANNIHVDKALLLLAEGPETSLSVWAATGHETWCALGSIANIDPPDGRPIVIAADDNPRASDEKRGAAARVLADAMARWKGEDRTFTIAYPWPVRQHDGSDFNDVIQAGGVAAVRSRIDGAAAPEPPPPRRLPAYYQAATEPRDAALARQRGIITSAIADGAARTALRQDIRRRRDAEIERLDLEGEEVSPQKKGALTRRFTREVLHENGLSRMPKAKRVLITGSQGSGKTRASLEEIARVETAAVAWLTVPTLEKAEEAAADYRQIAGPHSMPVRVVRGRGAPDPKHPDFQNTDLPKEQKTKMCRRSKMMERLAQRGLPGRKLICPACFFNEVCGSLRQEREIADVKERGLFAMARNYLSFQSPAPPPDILVADERITLEAVDSVLSVSPDILISAVPFHGSGLGNVIALQVAVNTLRETLMKPAPLSRLREDPGLVADLREAVKAVEAAMERHEPEINGEMSDNEILTILDNLPFSNLGRVASVIRAVLRELPSGRDDLNAVQFNPAQRVKVDGKEEEQPRILVHRLKMPRLAPTTLLLDGTGSAALNRILIPGLEAHHVPIERDAHTTGTVCPTWPYLATMGRRMRDGSVLPVEVEVHPDPRAQAVLEQIREAEVMQTADRVRPIFNRRRMVLANNLVLDVTYDRFLSHAELVAGGTSWDRAWQAVGMIPLGASDLHKVHPDLFPSAAKAKDFLKALQTSGGDLQIDPYLETTPTYFRYRREGQRGSASRVAVDLKRHVNPRLTVEAFLGALVLFEPWDAPEPPNGPESKPDQKTETVADMPPSETVWRRTELPLHHPTAWADDPGWQPDTAGLSLDNFERWEAQLADAPPPPEPEQEHKMQFSDQDEILLDPGAAYAKMPVGVVLVEPITNMVRLPIGLASCAARRGDRRLVDELRALVPPGRLGIGLLLGRPELSG